MTRTKTIDYTGVGTAGRSKPLPRLPLKKKSSAALTEATNKSSYASTPSKFYISDQESLLESPSPTRSAQGSHLGRRLYSNKNRAVLPTVGDTPSHERPSRSIKSTAVGNSRSFGGGGGGVGVDKGKGKEIIEEEALDTVGIYSPVSDAQHTPHLISRNTITYHSNFFEEPEDDLGRNDPLEVQIDLAAFPSPLSPSAVDHRPFISPVPGRAGTSASANTGAVARQATFPGGALSPVDLDSESSDFYQHHQYQQARRRHQPHYTHHHHHHHQGPLPSHRNRSFQRSYEGSPSGLGGTGESRNRQKPVQLEYYEVEGSWLQDATGRAFYRGTGKIEEIREVEEGDAMDDDPILSPRKSSVESAKLNSEGRLPKFRTSGQFELTSPLPPTTTPPPRPGRVEEVVLSPGGTNFSIPKTVFNSGVFSEIGVGRGNGSGHGHRRPGLGMHLDIPMELDIPISGLNSSSAPPPAAISTPLASPQVIQKEEPPELDLETQSLMQMLKHVTTGVGDVKTLRDYFIRMCAVYFLRKHIDVTYRVEAALLSVQEAIDRRRSIPQSHLDIRTAEWQEKFELRLVSFRTTTQRLTSLREFVQRRKKLTEKHLEDLFQKLLAHEMKYTDIAAKLHASYDRLKLRHLHTQLESAYKAEVESRKERKTRRRRSFQRKRTEEFAHERGPSTA